LHRFAAVIMPFLEPADALRMRKDMIEKGYVSAETVPSPAAHSPDIVLLP